MLSSRAAFRQGIVQGDKAVIHPILEWLLKSIPDLRKRAYLARYLVKIDIPPDFIADEQISELFLQVSIFMRSFLKYIHMREFCAVNNFPIVAIDNMIMTSENIASNDETLLKTNCSMRA